MLINNTNTYFSFDTVNRVWQPRQKMPNALHAYSIEEFNGQIYIFGGHTSNGQISQSLYCYYPDTNSWTEKSRISTTHNCTTALAKTSQFLYVMGSNAIVHQYEPARDVWTNVIIIIIPFYILHLRNGASCKYLNCFLAWIVWQHRRSFTKPQLLQSNLRCMLEWTIWHFGTADKKCHFQPFTTGAISVYLGSCIFS